MKRIFYLLIPAFFLLQSCEDEINWVPDDAPVAPLVPPTTPYVPDQSFKIVAYFPASRNIDSVDARKFKMITHLNYAFLTPNADGSLKPLDQPMHFKRVMGIARDNGVKTAISLGGGEAIYSALAANPGHRKRLVNNLVKFVLANNLDGVDLDWEYPRADKANDITYTALVKELSDTLHVWHKFVSAAVTPAVYAGNVRNGITLESIQYVDFLNIMVYDGLGWDTNDPNQHSSYKMAETSLNIWLNQKGLPKTKAVLGIPAYGRAQAAGSPAVTYRDILRAGGNAAANSHTVNNLPYFYNGTELVKQKALLAKSQANGIMLWEFYQDVNDDRSLLKAANDAIGRTY